MSPKAPYMPYIPRSYQDLLEMPLKPQRGRPRHTKTLSDKEAKRRAHAQCRRYLKSRDMVKLQLPVPASFRARLHEIAAQQGISSVKFMLTAIVAAVNAAQPHATPIAMEDLLPSAQPVPEKTTIE